MNTKMSKTEMLAAINQQHGTLLELGLDGKDAVISLVKVADITGRSHRHLMERARSFIDGQKLGHLPNNWEVSSEPLATDGEEQKLGHQPKNWQIYFSYEPTAYLDGYGREMPTYNLNRAAFFDFVLSMTGKKVDAIRKTYIQAFDAFEQLALHEMHHEVAAVRLKLEHKQHSESIDELVKRLTPVAKMMIMHRQLEPSLSRRAAYQYLKKNILDFQSKFPRERDFNIVLGKIKWINHDPSSSDNGKAYDRALGRGFVISYNPNKQGIKLEASKITALGMLYLQERMEQLYEQSVA
ncbi:Rha family transcriptional regulator [Aeromonas bestiarum]|uniref:Rha family transcriptional regulator n=1 Tax=Aeromonas bestiarum TaxID=105751 RepID=A0AAW7HX86_9GAMM|nr:Rha family transcriptional regulator [Aeromonas bestiarum]MDM5140469.1 Rha family transcriptional regulator [Aeromonas bestiarum]